MKHFTLYGETPSKKNSRVFNYKTKRLYTSARYNTWHDKAMGELLQQKQGFTISECKIVMIFYHEDLIKRDADNAVNSIFDTLKDAGIIEDDNWKLIGKHYVENHLDRHNPRAEIYIYDPAEKITIKF